jgi:hypothetical protein
MELRALAAFDILKVDVLTPLVVKGRVVNIRIILKYFFQSRRSLNAAMRFSSDRDLLASIVD